MEEIKQMILDILSENLELSVENIIDEFQNGVEMDSFQIIMFISEIEDNFKIEYNQFSELSMHMDNLADFINYLAEFIIVEGKNDGK